MYAIYVRQSVDKRDSISIETQTDECKHKVPINGSFEIYEDKGFSGKSVENRPAFQKMMADVKNKKISTIITYKFDRISRSLMDFLNMQKTLEEYNVKLISCNENFDTSNLVGEAMLNVLMVFAEMERKTIQQRIKDNYYSRGEKGLYLGGYAPFGYDKIEIKVNGKKTYTFKENLNESIILRGMYEDFLNGKSLGELARELNDKKIPTRKNAPWSAICVSRMLKSPVYVKANADVYNYLLSLGGHMTNSIEDYKGVKGCYVYGETAKRKGAKFVNLENDFVSLGFHEGIIDASLWLGVQNIFAQRKGHSNIGSGSLTWLQGLIKCKCGYTYYAKHYKPNKNKKEYKYLYCRGRKNNACPYPRVMIQVETIESIVEELLFSRLLELKDIQQSGIVKDSPEINTLKIKLSEIDKKINNMIATLAEGESITIEYINQHIKILDSEKKKIIEKITSLELKSNRAGKSKLNIEDITKHWYSYNIETKKKITKELIEVIILEGNNIEVKFF